MNCPSIDKAKEIIFNRFHDEGQRFHVVNVARLAQKIAQRCGLSEEKAGALGLLHDYGYTAEKLQPEFHGKVGFEEMSKLGYHDVAKICITHSFPNKDLSVGTYKQEWIDWTQEKLQYFEYDDYDRLIQFCDMLVGDKLVTSCEERIRDVSIRHKIPEEKQRILYKNALELKEYFDKKCGCDVYSLLEIKSDAKI